MNHRKAKRILVIALSSRGFGYTIMEGSDRLIKYGRKTASGNKNIRCLIQIKQLIDFFRPEVMVLQNMAIKSCKRASRIKKLNSKIIESTKKRRIPVNLFSTEQVRRAFAADESGTEHGRAKIVAEQFPEALGPRLPPKRRAGHNENARMDIFDAAAMGWTYYKFHQILP